MLVFEWKLFQDLLAQLAFYGNSCCTCLLRFNWNWRFEIEKKIAVLLRKLFFWRFIKVSMNVHQSHQNFQIIRKNSNKKLSFYSYSLESYKIHTTIPSTKSFNYFCRFSFNYFQRLVILIKNPPKIKWTVLGTCKTSSKARLSQLLNITPKNVLPKRDSHNHNIVTVWTSKPVNQPARQHTA